MAPPSLRKSSVERVEAPVTAKAYLMCAFAAFAGVLFGEMPLCFLFSEMYLADQTCRI